MNKHITTLRILCCLLPVQAIQAQSGIPCAADFLHQLAQQDPVFYQQHQALEQEAYDFFLHRKKSAVAERSSQVLTIPVVVHIIHNNGPENVSDAAVQQSITWLNEAFANEGYYAQGSGADAGIRFCLAQRGPGGLATNGITRDQNALTEFSVESQDVAMKNLNRWKPQDYINIWVVKDICSVTYGCGIVAYAYHPSYHGGNKDGIVVEAQLLASPANVSALAHEMGHYFGLYHTFEGGCTNNDCLIDGDKVCDTPPDQSTAAVPCGQTVNTCSTDAQSGFAADQPDMTWNHMDYGHLDCKHDFTAGQADRMNFFLSGARKSLLDSKGCLPPCPFPAAAAFTPGDTTIQAGQTLFFDNTSQNAVTFSWTLNGVPFGGQQNAAYLFDSAGVFTMQLLAQPLNAQLCDASTAQATVQVLCPVVADFTLSDPTPEEGQTVYIANNSLNASQFEWLVNGVSQGAALDSIVFTETGSYQIRLVAWGASCKVDAQEDVFVRDSCTSKTFVLDFTIQNEVEDWKIQSSAVLTDGNLILAGGNKQSTLDFDSSQIFLVKTKPDGTILWVKLAGEDVGVASSCPAIAATPDGGFAAILMQFASPTDSLGDIFVSKFSTDGAIEWSRRIVGTVIGFSIITTQDGGILVDCKLKFDANGNLLWSKTHPFFDGDVKTVLMPDGGFAAMSSFINGDTYIARFTADGSVLWCKSVSQTQTTILDFAVSPDMDIILLAQRYTINLGGVYHTVLIKITPDGDIAWSRRYFRKQAFWFEPAAFALSNDGITVVALSTVSVWPTTIKKYRAMLHTDYDGNIAWVRHFEDDLYSEITLHSVQDGYIGLKNFDRFKADPLGFAGDCESTHYDILREDLMPAFDILPISSNQGVSNFPLEAPPVFEAQLVPYSLDTLCAPACPRGIELCNNNLDDDEDGLFDCLDPDCNCPEDVCAPKQANIWYFGNHAGLDFSTEPPTVLTDGQMQNYFASATVCDERGHLIFYTDGDTIFNRFHQPMPNGMDLVDVSGVTNLQSQAIVIPNPADKAQHYLFSLGSGIYSSFISYSLIDMHLDGGQGDVVPGQKKVFFHSTTVETEFTAIRSCLSDEYWLLLRGQPDNNFYAYKIGQNGLVISPVMSIGGTAPSIYGQMKFSPDGSRVARTGNDVMVELYDFDLATGLISNPLLLNFPSNYRTMGVEFSSSGRYLYFSAFDLSGDKLFQIDLDAGSADQIINSLTLLASGTSDIDFGTLQLAPNGKIYVAPRELFSLTAYGHALHVIHQPDLKGTASQYQENGLPLSGTPGTEYGLVNVVQSLFAKPAIAFSQNAPDTICILDSTYSYIVKKSGCYPTDSIDWKIEGLANTLNADNTQAWIKFEAPGEGRLVATYPTACGTVVDTLQILVTEPFNKTLDLGPDRIVCDNGVFTFNAGSGYARYRWQNGAPDSVLTTLLPGQYWVEVWDACGNRQSDTVTISIAPATVLDLGPDRAGCDDLSAAFQRPAFFTRWQWTPADFVSCDTCAAVIIAPVATTSWVVVAQTDDGCISVDSLTFRVQDTLFFQIDTSVCIGQAVDLFGMPLPADTSAQFFFPASGPGCDTLLTVNVLGLDAPSSEVEVTICPGTFFNFNGVQIPADTTATFLLPGAGSACDSVVMVSVATWPPLSVTLPPDTTLRIGAALSIGSESAGAGTLTFAWSPAGSLSCSDCPEPIAMPLETTLYTLSVADVSGCTAQDSMLVTVETTCIVIIPNAFTPNGDGINDRFYPKTDPCVRTVRAWRVLSRWGEAVFERFNFQPNDPNLGWDGNRPGGEPFPSDVLVWYAELEYFDGRKEVRKGDVALLR